MTLYLNEVDCLECGHKMLGDMTITKCEWCGSHWVDALYDYDKVAGIWPATLQSRDHSLWRYAELLPLAQNPEISMGEGYTPLIRLYQYERLHNHQHIYVKDERQGPTSSFKDRQAALAVTAMRQLGIKECVLASAGNAGSAYAAYCARAGIKLWLFLTSLVPSDKVREATLYGAEVIKVVGTYDETKQVATEFAKRKSIHMDGGAKAIPSKESMKTIAYEIAEQLGLSLGTTNKFVSPDWYIQAVSGGIGPLGAWKGFCELLRMGLIDKMPRLGIVQAAGCSPMVKAYVAGRQKADPVVPKTLITVLATGDPGFSYVKLREAVLSNNGVFLAIEDGHTFAAMRRFAEVAGISVEPATAVAVAGLEKMLHDGIIGPDETVVMNCSGHTFPVESHILGDQYLLNLKLAQSEPSKSSNKNDDGISKALENLDEQITTILVVDDNLSDRRLIRRLLQRHKSYRVLEAHNGVEALRMVRERKPDLIISDLTMPEMDGFTLLEKLKCDVATASIPTVIVSAKSLTLENRRALEEQTSAIWTKGSFDTRQLVEHVIRTLGHKPSQVTKTQITETITISSTSSFADETQNGAELPTIVVIDDNSDDLRLTQRYLKMSGHYNVVGACTGREGIKAAYAHHPDLIILDLMLPDISGFEILEALKANSDLCDIPIIVISAKELMRDEVEMLKSCVHTNLEKASLNREIFTATIGNILATK